MKTVFFYVKLYFQTKIEIDNLFFLASAMNDSNELNNCTTDWTETLASEAWRIINQTQMSIDVDRCDAENLDTFNCSEEEFILYERGEKVSNLWFAIPVTISYALILVCGFIGNAAVCLVIAYNRTMHTNTNYYLFNLAIADTLYLLFGLPFEIHMFWYNYPWLFGEIFCKVKSLISEACSYASVLTIVAFSMERYLAICHPLYTHVMNSFRRVIFVIGMIWIISLLSALPFAYYRYLNYVYYPPENGNRIDETAICIMRATFKGLYETSTIIFFIIPLFVLIIMYARIAKKLYNREESLKRGQFGKCTASNKPATCKTIIRMLIVIVITFFISWAPFHAQRLVFLYGRHWKNYREINELLFTATGVFYYLSCTINPITYNIMSRRYRDAFHKTFFRQKIPTPSTITLKKTTISMQPNQQQ